eukprot:5544440-Pyramimonas_sp.AAC.1
MFDTLFYSGDTQRKRDESLFNKYLYVYMYVCIARKRVLFREPEKHVILPEGLRWHAFLVESKLSGAAWDAVGQWTEEPSGFDTTCEKLRKLQGPLPS